MADRIRVLGRSFLIQASWSYDRMQSLGFGYAMLPALRKLYPAPADFEERVAVHSDYFNTQPYLAAFVLGAAVRLEEERASGNRSVDPAEMKAALMAPLGALGDSFFWGSLKPLAAVIAVSMVLAGYGWGPLLFLVLYNVCHIGLRSGVFFWGYASGGDVVFLMSRYNFTKMARLFKAASLVALGALLASAARWRSEFRLSAAVSEPVTVAGALAVTLIFCAVLRRGVSPVKFMLGLAAGCLVLAYAGVV